MAATYDGLAVSDCDCFGTATHYSCLFIKAKEHNIATSKWELVNRNEQAFKVVWLMHYNRSGLDRL